MRTRKLSAGGPPAYNWNAIAQNSYNLDPTQVMDRPLTKVGALYNETYQQPTASGSTKFDWNGAVNDVAPFVSNLVNLFRRPPKPTMGKMDDYVTLSRNNYSDARYQAAKDIDTSDIGTNRIVDPATGAAIRQFNLGRKLSAISSINEKEANDNTAIANQQAMINTQIRQGNNNAQDAFNQQQQEYEIARQRSSSENLANFSDKYVGIENEKSKAEVDKQSNNLMASLYERNGVLQRQAMQWKSAGLPDPFGRNYDYLTDPTIPKKMGGFIKLK